MFPNRLPHDTHAGTQTLSDGAVNASSLIGERSTAEYPAGDSTGDCQPDLKITGFFSAPDFVLPIYRRIPMIVNNLIRIYRT